MINSYWFSYVLFLTFLGGLLVLFIYITRIASNEIFEFSSIKIIFIIIRLFTITILFTIILYKKLNWLNFSFNYEINNFFEKYLFFNNENKINLTKLYNEQTFILIIIIIIYLFISLIIVIKITNISFGPLRIFN